VICFFEFLTPFTLGNHNFLNSIPFSMIFSVPYASIGGVQVFLDTKNNVALPLNLASLERLGVIVVIQLQLKYLIHMFCL
jgi:hypothetical protein